MESDNLNQRTGKNAEVVKSENFLGASILLSAIILAGAWMYTAESQPKSSEDAVGETQEVVQPVSALEAEVLPEAGVGLPISWGDLGAKLTSVGAIDGEKFRALYLSRGEFPADYEKLLSGNNLEKLKITKDNAGYLLNLFWALGLASKNQILETGEMSYPTYGGAANFASTGGWTMAKGSPMDHYSRHLFFSLTPEQQVLVDKVSRGIYRPCCGNSTHFPDCNHGMAMLGLLELMASQGVSEQEMWRTALSVNSYWFPDTYLTIATYMKNKGVEWKDAKPQEMLGVNFSSASGYARIVSQVVAPSSSGGGAGGCGVGAGVSAPVQSVPARSSSGCGI